MNELYPPPTPHPILAKYYAVLLVFAFTIGAVAGGATAYYQTKHHYDEYGIAHRFAAVDHYGRVYWKSYVSFYEEITGDSP